jgi:IrrE N-terminal-like domain
MDVWDHEGNALAIYAEAHENPSDPQGPFVLAESLGVRIRYDAPRMLRPAAFAVVNGEEMIFLRRKLSDAQERFLIYHELAERLLRKSGDELTELSCVQLAACLRMPPPAFRQLVRVVGFDLPKLAAPWCASETGAALRWLETTGTPGVVVTPGDIRVRGEEWAWPDEGELRRLARARNLPAGLRKVHIRDRRGAVVLMAE